MSLELRVKEKLLRYPEEMFFMSKIDTYISNLLFFRELLIDTCCYHGQ